MSCRQGQTASCQPPGLMTLQLADLEFCSRSGRSTCTKVSPSRSANSSSTRRTCGAAGTTARANLTTTTAAQPWTSLTGRTGGRSGACPSSPSNTGSVSARAASTRSVDEVTASVNTATLKPVFTQQAAALVHIYKDGSVLVTHGGAEMGQGLHTKVQQVLKPGWFETFRRAKENGLFAS